MKNILIVYIGMVIGGSTTSLLSILNNLDYEKYHVDLLLSDHRGELFEKIPPKVNILAPALPNIRLIRLKKCFSPKCVLNFVKSRYLVMKHRNFWVSQQITAYDTAQLTRKISKQYDIAISFLELWPAYYVADFVEAEKKIGWLHVDYKETGFVPHLDLKRFEKFDKIVTVSETCRDNLASSFPSIKNKIICIENILSAAVIKELSEQPVKDFVTDSSKLNISTVCRIDFEHKGLDRGVEVFGRLNKENMLNDIRWYVIGDGQDFFKLKHLIKLHKLEHVIFLLGKKLNPYAYIKETDLFFLPSRREGKPMAVTEALMLGIPPVVARYASANEQIKDGTDGLVFNNDEDSIYEGLKKLILDRTTIRVLKANINRTAYSTTEEMQKINALLEE